MLNQQITKSAFQNKQLQTTKTVIFGQNHYDLLTTISTNEYQPGPMSTNNQPQAPMPEIHYFFQALAKLLTYLPIH